MCENMFNFVNGIVTCLLHYRGRIAKKSFNDKIKLVQNPNSEKKDMVYDREDAEAFYQKCLPFTYETIMENKLLLRSEDTLLPRRMFDNSRYICMTYDIGGRLRRDFKVGFRPNEVDYIKKKATQIQKWAFAIAEFNVVLSYRTIDEQGFVLIAELMEGENKFDKAMRIAQVIYEYLGFNVGDKYVGFLPESKLSFSTDICPMSFDENYLFGYLDANGRFFGSFDCMKLEGTAESVLNENEIEKQGDIRQEELEFTYSEEMMYFEEKKYDVIHTTGLKIRIKYGIKPESEWILPARQLEFSDNGIKIVYNNAELKTKDVDKQISEGQINFLKEQFPDDDNIFTMVNKNGVYEPCNLSRFKSLADECRMMGVIDSPIFYFGGYQKQETGTFVPSKYLLFRIKSPKDPEKVKEYVKTDKDFKDKAVCFFKCPETNDDLFIVLRNTSRNKYLTEWAKFGLKFNDVALEPYEYTKEEDCLCTTPLYDSLEIV